MARGGRRPGAGRKPKSNPNPLDFRLIERLRALPSTGEGLARRVALALGSYGATVAEIAAVLDVTEQAVETSYAQELETAKLLLGANAIVGLWERAQSGSVQALLWWIRRTLVSRH